MLYIPTSSEDEYWAIVPRSFTTGIDWQTTEESFLLDLYGPQGQFEITVFPEEFGPFYVLQLDAYAGIPTGEYSYVLREEGDDNRDLESGVCRVFADPVETTQYNPTHNVKEYE